MKRHIIFACIYEYVCTMVMKKFTFLLITLFSSTLILLADNPYRSYTVADGLSNSTVKAIYQDEMGYSFMNPMRPSDNPMILSVSQETGKAECGLELLMELHFSIPLRRNI